MRAFTVISFLVLFSFAKAQDENTPGYIEGGFSENECKNIYERKIKKQNNLCKINPIEGIWQTTDGNKYAILGISFSSRVYYGRHTGLSSIWPKSYMLIILQSSNDRIWPNGCIKGYIEGSSVDGVYSMDYFTNKTLYGYNFKGLRKDILFLTLDSPITASFTKKNGQRVSMLKLYPKEDVTQPPSISSDVQSWTGTGFALNSNYVVTNYHVIENAKTITLTGINGNFANKYPASVAATDKNNDLALLKLNGNVSITSIPYSIKATTSDVGEEVFVLGYPLTATMGDEIKLTTGVISSKSGFQGDVSQYQISAPVQPGNSGGPLFDSKGTIIGIVSAKHIGAENVGYAVKISYLKSLVESAVSANILPQTNRVATQNLSGKVKAVKNYVYYIQCSR